MPGSMPFESSEKFSMPEANQLIVGFSAHSSSDVELSRFLCSGLIQYDGSLEHYSDVIMSTMASQITSLTVDYSTVYSGADQRRDQSSASLAFVREIQRSPVNSPHKGPVTWKMYPFDDVIMMVAIQKVRAHTKSSASNFSYGIFTLIQHPT